MLIVVGIYAVLYSLKSENKFLSKINEFVLKERVIQVRSIQIELYVSIKSVWRK